MDPVTLPLDHPFTHEGAEYTALTMRRPKVRDDKAARRGGASPEDRELRLFSNLCEVAPGVIEEMDLADYSRLQERFRDFFPAELRPR